MGQIFPHPKIIIDPTGSIRNMFVYFDLHLSSINICFQSDYIVKYNHRKESAQSLNILFSEKL